uniref:DUF397 domain-containing protein n=1 Tax=Streptomyces griseoruber TaxID=1943 RepID=UPI0012FE9434
MARQGLTDARRKLVIFFEGAHSLGRRRVRTTRTCPGWATTPTHTSVRDTKAPAGGTLTFPAEAFDTFLTGLLDRDRL